MSQKIQVCRKEAFFDVHFFPQGNPLDRNMRPRTFEEQLAMKGEPAMLAYHRGRVESEAEKNLVPLNEAPPYGFLSVQRSRNRNLQRLGMYRKTENSPLPVNTVKAAAERCAEEGNQGAGTSKQGGVKC